MKKVNPAFLKSKANSAHIEKCVSLHSDLVNALDRFMQHSLSGKEQTRISVKELGEMNDLLKKAKGE